MKVESGYQKKVILYIDKPLTNPYPNDLIKLEVIKSKGVTVENSLDELKGGIEIKDGDFICYFNKER